MAEQQAGLRFDIYERVHLQEGVDAIRELNDVELNPHIQVLTQGGQAVLQGNLMLTGSYVSEEGEQLRTLEHLIPVEITLPLNRIHRVEDIMVEIENFDVDLLSSRSLNVTGVLSLQGLEMITQSASESWQEEEEVTFVHEAAEMRSEPVPKTPASQAPVMQAPAPQVAAPPPAMQFQQEVPAPSTAMPPMAAQESPLIAAPPQAAPPLVASPQLEVQSPEQTVDASAAGGELQVEAEIQEIKVASDPEVGTIITEDKKEVKLAFGKKAEEAVEIKPYGIKSLLSKAGSMIQGEKRKEETDGAHAAEHKTEPVEWKRLFLRDGENAQEFSKVRMCIVQKEETLETIAKRYQLNPRELQLLNRLSDSDITPGQIIYLPR